MRDLVATATASVDGCGGLCDERRASLPRVAARRGKMMAWCAAAVAMCVACKGGKGDCRTEATELQRFLEGAYTGGTLPDEPDIALVIRADLPALPAESAQTVRISRSSTRVGFDGTGDLAERLEKERAVYRSSRVYFQIDRDAPWERVAAALQAVEKLALTPIFAFERGTKAERPPRTEVDDELDKLAGVDASQRSSKLAQLTAILLRTCPSLIRTFGAVSSSDGDKSRALIAALGDALIECDCATDMPSLRSLLWRVVATEKPLTGLAVTLAGTGKPFAFPAATPWRDVAIRLTTSTTSISVAVQ